MAKAIVVYDSAYGNTYKIAARIAKACGGELLTVDEVALDDVRTAHLLVVGSPTQGGRPTQRIQDFIKQLPSDVLRDKHVATFDTRFALNGHGFWLKYLMKTIGFAAPRIAKLLQAKGGHVVVEPKGFIVSDREGPLRNLELEHASLWGKILLRT